MEIKDFKLQSSIPSIIQLHFKPMKPNFNHRSMTAQIIKFYLQNDSTTMSLLKQEYNVSLNRLYSLMTMNQPNEIDHSEVIHLLTLCMNALDQQWKVDIFPNPNDFILKCLQMAHHLNQFTADDQIHASLKLLIATQLEYLLKLMIAAFSRLNHSDYTLSERQQILEECMDLYSPHVYYANEIYKLCGVLIGIVLETHEQAFDWIYTMDDSLPHSFNCLNETSIEYKLTRFKQMCILRGVFQTWKDKSFLSLKIQNKTISNVLFTHLEKTCLEAIDPLDKVIAFENLSLWFLSLEKQYDLQIEEIQVTKSLEFVFSHWEDPADVIQHKLHTLFLLIVDLLVTNDELQVLFSRISQLNPYQRVKYDLLSLMTCKVSSNQMIEWIPDIVPDCLNMLISTSNPIRISAFISQFILSFHAQNPESTWTWIKPLAHVLAAGTNHKEKNHTKLIGDTILLNVFKAIPNSFTLLLDELNSKENQNLLFARLTVLKAAKSSGCIKNNWISKSNEGYISFESLEWILTCRDLNLCKEGFDLICTSDQGTADFSIQELQLLLSCLKCSLDSNSADYRQSICASFRKAFTRLKRTIYATLRVKKKEEHFKSTLDQHRIQDLKETEIYLQELMDNLYEKKEFLQSLYDFIQSRLYPGTNISRQTFALELLAIMIDVSLPNDSFTNFDLNSEPGFPSICSQKAWDKVYSFIMHGDYETDRIKAFELCKTLSLYLKLEPPSFMRQDADFLFSSLHPSHIEAGILIYRLYFSLQNEPSGQETNCTVATNNLYLAAKNSPMHPYIGALNSICKEFKNQKGQVLESFIEHLFKVSERASQIVLFICADESPEGNLPSSFKDMQLKMEKLTLESKNHSQLILHECFHTLKESTSLLTTLVSFLESQKSNLKWIKRVGELLAKLLSAVRHRGAFSAINVNFEKYVAILLEKSDPDYIEIIKGLLNQFMNQLVTAGASITRRSAGLPMAIVSIVVKTSNGKKLFLDLVMQSLFEIANTPISSTVDIHDKPQVHAVNVIKTILNDSCLSWDSRKYMGNAFKLCINGLSSDYFPMRNGAVMLFAVLVQKTISSKSYDLESITAREFFTRYPTLFSIFYDKLEFAVQELEKGFVHPALYPILSILAKLRPCALEGDKSTIKLNAFSCFILRVCGCSFWKIREIAAQAYCFTISLTEVPNELTRLSLSLSMDKCCMNEIHGSLLVIQSLLKALFVGNNTTDFNANLNSIFTNLKWILDLNCPLTSALYLSLITQYGSKESCPQELYETVYNDFQQSLYNSKKVLDFTLSVEQARYLCLYQMDTYTLQSFVLTHPDYEVQIIGLEYLIQNKQFLTLQVQSHLLDTILESNDKRNSQVIHLSIKAIIESFESNPIPLSKKQSDEFKTLFSSKVYELKLLLPLLGIVIRGNPELIDFYLQKLKESISQVASFETRQSILKSISYSQVLQNHQHRLDLLFILDSFLVDEFTEIRNEAALLLSSCQIIDTRLNHSLIRKDLLAYCIKTYPLEKEYIQEKLLCVLICKNFKEILSFELNSFGLLFPPEAANPRYEPFDYIEYVMRVLIDMGISEKTKREIQKYQLEYQVEFTKIPQSMFTFWIQRAPIYTLYFQLEVMNELLA